MPGLPFSCLVQLPCEDPGYSDLELSPQMLLSLMLFLCVFSQPIPSLYFQGLSQLSWLFA